MRARETESIVKVSEAGFEARAGDVLVVTYGEIKFPIVQYSSFAVGGNSYTRSLLPGDDVQTEWNRIYSFLVKQSEHNAREKIKVWTEQLRLAGLR